MAPELSRGPAARRGGKRESGRGTLEGGLTEPGSGGPQAAGPLGWARAPCADPEPWACGAGGGWEALEKMHFEGA